MVYWKIKFSKEADKEFHKLDKYNQRLIQTYINKKVLTLKHPQQLGKALLGDLKGLWRYRVDKFRIICKIKEDQFIVLIVKIGKRDEVYP